MPETPIVPMISPLRMIGMSECLADGFDRHLALGDRQAIVEGGDYVLDAFDDFPHLGEMRRVQPFRAAERKCSSVERDRIVAADRVEDSLHRAAAHIVFGVHLEPRGGRGRVEDFLVVAKAQPDPGLRRDRVAPREQRGYARLQLQPRSGGGRLAALDLGAVARRQQHEGLRVARLGFLRTGYCQVVLRRF